MLFIVEEDEASDPIDVGILGADGVVADAEFLPDLVEQFRLLRLCRRVR